MSNKCTFCNNTANATEHLCHDCTEAIYFGDMLESIASIHIGGPLDEDMYTSMAPYKQEAKTYWCEIELRLELEKLVAHECRWNIINGED